MTRTSGNCIPDVSTTPLPLDGGLGYPPDCTVDESRTPDNCTTTVAVACPTGMGRFTSREQVTWAASGDAGHGMGSTTTYASDGGVTCSSTYTIAYERTEGP